jgi:hypothetical protein
MGTWNLTNITGTITLPTGAATAANQTSTIGSVAPGTAATNSLLAGGVYNSAGVTLTNGQQAGLQFDSTGHLLTTATGGGGGGAVTNAGTFAVQNTGPGLTPDAGSLVSFTTTTAALLGGSGTTVQMVNNGLSGVHFRLGTTSAVTATTSDPRIPPGNALPIGRGTNTYIAFIADSGSIAVDTFTGTGPGVSGPFTNLAAAGYSQIVGSNGSTVAEVKAASTAPATTDPALTINYSPNPSLVCSGKIPISQTASTDLKTSTNKLYLCSIILVTATAQSVSLVEGTGTTCATGTAAIIGGTTASAAFAINGGVSAPSPFPQTKTSTTGDHLCLLQSGAGNISGLITYADAP